ncbi:MAG TPA: OsmC family protein [Gemmatimonadaceae bacterium]
MKIILRGEDAIRLEVGPGPMTIEAESAEQQYSPFHMLASSLATCTFSVLYSWATHVKLEGADRITIDVSWEFADDPHRVGRMDLSFDWPGLPEKRLQAARRVAEMCTVHATLMHPPVLNISPAGAPTAGAVEAIPSPAPVEAAGSQAEPTGA